MWYPELYTSLKTDIRTTQHISSNDYIKAHFEYFAKFLPFMKQLYPQLFFARCISLRFSILISLFIIDLQPFLKYIYIYL